MLLHIHLDITTGVQMRKFLTHLKDTSTNQTKDQVLIVTSLCKHIMKALMHVRAIQIEIVMTILTLPRAIQIEIVMTTQIILQIVGADLIQV
jgi:hypothetical protein